MGTESCEKTILAFAPGVWGWPEFAGSPRYHLWELAGRGWTVLYVEPPQKFCIRPRFWKAPDRAFHVLTPAMVPPFGMRLAKTRLIGQTLRAIAGKRLWVEGLAACRRLKLRPRVLWLGAPWHGNLAEYAPKSWAKVAHVYDELPESPAFSSFQRSLLWHWERELLARCNVTFCSSDPQAKKRRAVARRVELLENAVRDDFVLSDEAKCPLAYQPLWEKIRAVKCPRLVYGGVVDHRLDTSMFRAAVEALTHAQLILLGHMDASCDADFADFARHHPRVHIFGTIPYGAFPFLYREADVLLIAHRRTAFTDAMYPEKLNEYLASGKPVVSIDLPEVCRLAHESSHPASIRLAHDSQTFISEITDALEDCDPTALQARKALASRHTWTAMGKRADLVLSRLIES